MKIILNKVFLAWTIIFITLIISFYVILYNTNIKINECQANYSRKFFLNPNETLSPFCEELVKKGLQPLYNDDVVTYPI